MVKNTAVFFFPYKGLGYPDTVNALRNIGVQVGLLITLDLPCPVLLLLNQAGKDSQDGKTAHTHQSQLPINGKHEKDDEYQAAQVGYGIEETVG